MKPVEPVHAPVQAGDRADDQDVPVITCLLWKYVPESGNVIIRRQEHLSQQLILDRPSSAIWLAIDGRRTVAELRRLPSASKNFDLDRLLHELVDYGVVSYRSRLEEEW